MSSSKKHNFSLDYSMLDERVSLRRMLAKNRANNIDLLLRLVVINSFILVLFFGAEWIDGIRFSNVSGLFLVKVALLVITTITLCGMQFSQYYSEEKASRLRRFSEANGFDYFDYKTKVTKTHAGDAFHILTRRYVDHGFRSTRTPVFEVCNYDFDNYQSTNNNEADTDMTFASRLFGYGVVWMKLPVPLPHVILDAKSNNPFRITSNLPKTPKSEQRLSLGGDFDACFTLYTPVKCTQEVQRIFTPELQRFFVENLAKYDVEIVGKNIYIYSDTKFVLHTRAAIEEIFRIATAMESQISQISHDASNLYKNVLSARLKIRTFSVVIISLAIGGVAAAVFGVIFAILIN